MEHHERQSGKMVNQLATNITAISAKFNIYLTDLNISDHEFRGKK